MKDLERQTGDSDVPHEALFLQRHECRQGLADNLSEVPELYVVALDDVDVVCLEPL